MKSILNLYTQLRFSETFPEMLSWDHLSLGVVHKLRLQILPIFDHLPYLCLHWLTFGLPPTYL